MLGFFVFFGKGRGLEGVGVWRGVKGIWDEVFALNAWYIEEDRG